MRNSTFIFLSTFFLAIGSGSWLSRLDPQWLHTICFILILILGIPHGAIDNLLYLHEKRISHSRFFLVYTLCIGVNLAIWYFFAAFAFATFILISAYHFGQSQLDSYFKGRSRLFHLLYCCWGMFMLLGLMSLNRTSLLNLIEASSGFENLAIFLSNPLLLQLIFYTLGTCLIALMVYQYATGRIKLHDLLMEWLIMGMLFLSFHLFDPLIGFSMYFIILHAFRVMHDEFYFLKQSGIIVDFHGFIVKILPLTLVSFLGILMVILGIDLGWVKVSYGYSILVIIAALTVPHVYVMNIFYEIKQLGA